MEESRFSEEDVSEIEKIITLLQITEFCDDTIGVGWMSPVGKTKAQNFQAPNPTRRKETEKPWITNRKDNPAMISIKENVMNYVPVKHDQRAFPTENSKSKKTLETRLQKLLTFAEQQLDFELIKERETLVHQLERVLNDGKDIYFRNYRTSLLQEWQQDHRKNFLSELNKKCQSTSRLSFDKNNSKMVSFEIDEASELSRIIYEYKNNIAADVQEAVQFMIDDYSTQNFLSSKESVLPSPK